MANKQRRQTKRERKIEAKQRRLEEIRRRQRRARMRRITTVGTIVAVVAAIALITYTRGAAARKDRNELNKLAAAAGCDKLEEPGLLKADHITPPAKGRYNTTPPASGPHYNVAGKGPLPTGIHTEPMENEGQVHNLEHGHVGIQYKDLDPKILETLAPVVQENPQWIFLAPYELTGGNKLALTAWGKSLVCNTPNDKVDDVARKFIKLYRDKSTESVPGTPTPQTGVAPTPSVSASAAPTSTKSPKPKATVTVGKSPAPSVGEST